ncbi:MAG: lytic transglycosylase domain-containing protein [Glaciihabitans sp.]
MPRKRGAGGVWIAVSAVPLLALVGVAVWIGAAGAVRHDLSNDTYISGPVTDAPSDIPLTSPGTVMEPAAPEAAAAGPGIADAVDAGWLDSVSAATNVPRRALAAYAGAAVRLATEQPGCNLGWTTLAGIGQIESGHASHGGSTLLADGTTDRAIRGPALDGVDFMAIADTDGGVWDGDATWDRAVGPVQFIPGTWARWGADGNGDGVTDPNQIDDAVLAAGRYLCHSGDLSGVDGWRAAIFSYNHDNAYVDAVADQANAYARMS